MGMKNDNLVEVIKGYEVIDQKNKGYVFLRSPQGVNFTVDVDVVMELADKLREDEEYKDVFLK